MTIEEYSTLMGYEETCEFAEYETANFIYMMAGEMNKQDFCKEYKKAGKNPLFHLLAQEANKWEAFYKAMKAREEKTAHAILREADEVRTGGMDISADALDRIAIRAIGHDKCIKRKLDKGFELSESDKEYIKENLI